MITENNRRSGCKRRLIAPGVGRFQAWFSTNPWDPRYRKPDTSRLHRVVFLLPCLFFIWVASTIAANARPPNIIVLLTDDQRADTLGCMGNTIIQTPNIDRLATQGVLFENAFVTTSICVTSRASILSGQYATRHGIWKFSQNFTDEALAQTYPGVLKEAGYRTGFIGKWGVGDPPKKFFDYDRAFAGQGNYMIEVDGKPRRLTSVMGDQALEFLSQSAGTDNPFCLSVSFKAPHIQDSHNVLDQVYPYDPALGSLHEDATIPEPRLAAREYYDHLPDFLKNSENRARWAVRFWGPARYQDSMRSYYRLISGVDVVVGRIRAQLEELGIADNTIIVFTSDHGVYAGEYGFAGKWFAHDVSIRVPLIVYDPRQPEPAHGIRRQAIALNIDIAPTVVDLAGLPASKEYQGRSLTPLLQSADSAPWRHGFFYEHHFPHPRIPQSEAVRTERWKYIRYTGSKPAFEELYDLRDDPEESRNLALEPAFADQLSTMRKQWQAWHEAVRRRHTGAPL